MQGIYINQQRPKSKKAVREAAATNPASITIEATSIFGNEYGGPVAGVPEGAPIYFVGPDPHTKRNFYGTLTRQGDKVTVK